MFKEIDLNGFTYQWQEEVPIAVSKVLYFIPNYNTVLIMQYNTKLNGINVLNLLNNSVWAWAPEHGLK